MYQILIQIGGDIFFIVIYIPPKKWAWLNLNCLIY